jgi:hypothetical protein
MLCAGTEHLQNDFYLNLVFVIDKKCSRPLSTIA